MEETHGIHAHGGKHGSCHGGAVLGVFGRAHHRVVVRLEERADDGEDHDCEDRYDDAGGGVSGDWNCASWWAGGER